MYLRKFLLLRTTFGSRNCKKKKLLCDQCEKSNNWCLERENFENENIKKRYHSDENYFGETDWEIKCNEKNPIDFFFYERICTRNVARMEEREQIVNRDFKDFQKLLLGKIKSIFIVQYK